MEEKSIQAYIIKNGKEQYLSNSYVYNWVDNIDNVEGIYIALTKTDIIDTLKHVKKLYKDSRLVKITITEEEISEK